MIDDPNLVLPLATSINERGVAGFTHTVTNSEDQRKINCLYELVRNPLTGRATLTNSKRPGVSDFGGTYGTSTQTSFLVVDTLFGSQSEHGVFHLTSGGDLKFSPNLYATVTLLASGFTPSGIRPTYVDITAISNVNNVVVQMTGSGGGTHRVFFATGVTIAGGGAWTEITDAQFTTLDMVGKMEHMDGFAFILGSDNLINNSDSNSLANWSGTSLAKQIRQDKAMGLARIRNMLLAFGRETVEVFYNAGNTVGSPLGRVPQLHAKVGLLRPTWTNATHYYCTIGTSIYFVGRTGGGEGGFGVLPAACGLYSFNGSSFDKVSSVYIDKILSEQAEASSIFSVNSVSINGQQGVAVSFTIPGTATQRSLVFFPEWKEWFEWTSTKFSMVNSGSLFLGAGTNPHKLYRFSASDNWQDDSTSYPWMNQFKLPTNGSSRKRMVMYGLDADTDTSANTVTVEKSDNDCASFESLPSLDLTREKKVAFRGGSYIKRHIRLSATDARPKRIHNFIANVVN